MVDFFGVVDWSAVGSMLSGLGTIGGVAAVYFGARSAVANWRAQKQGENLIHASEDILGALFAYRAILYSIIIPFLEHEIKSEIRNGSISNAIERMTDYFDKAWVKLDEKRGEFDRAITLSYIYYDNEVAEDMVKLREIDGNTLSLKRMLKNIDLVNTVKPDADMVESMISSLGKVSAEMIAQMAVAKKIEDRILPHLISQESFQRRKQISTVR